MFCLVAILPAQLQLVCGALETRRSVAQAYVQAVRRIRPGDGWVLSLPSYGLPGCARIPTLYRIPNLTKLTNLFVLKSTKLVLDIEGGGENTRNKAVHHFGMC